jgi:hypothetical protein
MAEAQSILGQGKRGFSGSSGLTRIKMERIERQNHVAAERFPRAFGDQR